MEVHVLPGKRFSQKMIHGPADFFIIRGPRDASDAAMSVEAQRRILLECSRSDLSSSAFVLPFGRAAVQKMNEIRLRGQFANGGGKLMKLRIHFSL